MITEAIITGFVAVVGIAPVFLSITLAILTIALVIRKGQRIFA